MDSEVRAVGRMVVWVEAAAEVSTAIKGSLSQGYPSTSVPRVASTSSEFSIRVWAGEGHGGERHDHVDADQDDGRDARRARGVLGLLVEGDRRIQPK